ncbi:hypothetical protein [Pseudomonas syringae]|nr:hypothetical protein [Pseudomonas syringae]
MFNRISSSFHNYGSSSTSETSRASGATSVSNLSSATLGYTAAFKSNPERFLRDHTIDARHVLKMGDRLTDELLSNTIKQGHFALVHDADTGNFILTHVNAASAADRAKVIHAHWIPFKSGNSTPGYVDIPKDPRYATEQDSAPFAFTPGMNGCSIEVREHPNNEAYMRVFHNQHPESSTVNRLVSAISGDKISSFDADDYHDEDSRAPVAFNMMHFDRNSVNWKFIGQSLEFDPYNNQRLSRSRAGISTKDATD